MWDTAYPPTHPLQFSEHWPFASTERPPMHCPARHLVRVASHCRQNKVKCAIN